MDDNPLGNCCQQHACTQENRKNQHKRPFQHRILLSKKRNQRVKQNHPRQTQAHQRRKAVAHHAEFENSRRHHEKKDKQPCRDRAPVGGFDGHRSFSDGFLMPWLGRGLDGHFLRRGLFRGSGFLRFLFGGGFCRVFLFICCAHKGLLGGESPNCNLQVCPKAFPPGGKVPQCAHRGG